MSFATPQLWGKCVPCRCLLHRRRPWPGCLGCLCVEWVRPKQSLLAGEAPGNGGD